VIHGFAARELETPGEHSTIDAVKGPFLEGRSYLIVSRQQTRNEFRLARHPFKNARDHGSILCDTMFAALDQLVLTIFCPYLQGSRLATCVDPAFPFFAPIQGHSNFSRKRILFPGLYEEETLSIRAHVKLAVPRVET
jgi:hypothetical protein